MEYGNIEAIDVETNHLQWFANPLALVTPAWHQQKTDESRPRCLLMWLVHRQLRVFANHEMTCALCEGFGHQRGGWSQSGQELDRWRLWRRAQHGSTYGRVAGGKLSISWIFGNKMRYCLQQLQWQGIRLGKWLSYQSLDVPFRNDLFQTCPHQKKMTLNWNWTSELSTLTIIERESSQLTTYQQQEHDFQKHHAQFRWDPCVASNLIGQQHPLGSTSLGAAELIRRHRGRCGKPAALWGLEKKGPFHLWESNFYSPGKLKRF